MSLNPEELRKVGGTPEAEELDDIETDLGADGSVVVPAEGRSEDAVLEAMAEIYNGRKENQKPGTEVEEES